MHVNDSKEVGPLAVRSAINVVGLHRKLAEDVNSTYFKLFILNFADKINFNCKTEGFTELSRSHLLGKMV